MFQLQWRESWLEFCCVCCGRSPSANYFYGWVEGNWGPNERASLVSHLHQTESDYSKWFSKGTDTKPTLWRNNQEGKDKKELSKLEQLWLSGSDELVALSPPQPVDRARRRQKSVRWNWCGHQMEDSLTARLAWAPFDCWSALKRHFASARQFNSPASLKVFTGD